MEILVNHPRMFLVLTIACVSATGCFKSSGQSPTGPSGNHAPTITSLDVSPTGTGLMSATLFTFTAQGVGDPDGDALTYAWDPGDATTITSATAAGSHVFTKIGTFAVRVAVTDPSGLSASATRTVVVGNIAGTWDLTCQNIPAPVLALYPSFPTKFVATLSQDDKNVYGSLAASGLSHAFTTPGSVTDARGVGFGVEGFDNVWAPRDGDFYFHMTASSSLTGMTGSGQYCGSSVGTRR